MAPSHDLAKLRDALDIHHALRYTHSMDVLFSFLIVVVIVIGGRIMAAIDNLEGSVEALKVSVDKAVEVITGGNPDEARVQAAADAVEAERAKLDAVTG